MVDYTGNLNSHDEYLKILDKLENKTIYVEVVLIDGKKKNKLIDKFKNDVIESRKVNEWWGTTIKANNNLYKIKASNELFNYLRNFDTFTKYYKYGTNQKSLRIGDYSEITDFGLDDIAFFDKNDECLLCTTTHEGYIMINNNLTR